MNTATQLKALIRNLSKEKKIDAQILLRNYMLERLLERISFSEYRNNFILKGGMLVAAMVGIDTRSTMDMDATIKGYTVTPDAVSKIFESILAIQLDDFVEMKVKSITDIHDEAEYGGIRVSIETLFDKIRQNLKVDITTGEDITPKEICFSFKLMLEDREIKVMAYNIETVLAEKLETIISRSTTNTRMRDFYDIYILSKLQNNNIVAEILKEAIEATTKRRGTFELLSNASQIIERIDRNIFMQDLWKRYQKKYNYAADIEWIDVIKELRVLMNK